MTNKKTALVLGATGLVGREVVNLLRQDSRYERVTALVRQPLSSYYDGQNKLDCVRLQPSDPSQPWQDYKTLFAVDHVYICLGTTMKQAGSEQAFKHVDYHMVLQAAQLSALMQVKSLVYISSVDASAASRSFYLRTKGELESAIAGIPGLTQTFAVRPSLLVGQRSEFRLAERMGIGFAQLFSFLMLGPLKKYRPVKAEDVAAQMIQMQKFD